MIQVIKKNFHVSILFALATILALIYRNGILETADVHMHFHRVIATTVEMQNGYIWPRWSHYLHGGYGYPVYNYYSPGLYILGSFLHILFNISYQHIILLFFVITIFLYPLGAYLFARQITTPFGALVAATLYLFAPIRLTELIVRGNLPQFIAMGLLPFVLWAFYKALNTFKIRWLVFATVLFALVILSHHLIAFLFLPLLIFFALFHIVFFVQQKQTAFVLFSLSLFAGVCITAIYWLPALAELRYIQINTVQDKSFEVASNYSLFEQLISPTIPVNSLWINWNANDSFGPRVGILHFILVISSLYILLRPVDRRYKILAVLNGLLLLGCLFMMTPQSDVIWQTVPFIKYIQFPLRLLGLVAITTIVGVALIFRAIPHRFQPITAIVLIVLIIASVLPMLYAPSNIVSIQDERPTASLEYENQSGAVGITSTNEYLPIWVESRPMRLLNEEEQTTLNDMHWRIWVEEQSVPKNALVTYQPDAPRGRSAYQIIADSAFELQFKQMFFPGWEITLDGNVQSVYPTSEQGLLTVNIPAGNHRLEVYYAGTSLQHLATVISMISMLILSMLFVIPISIKHKAPIALATDSPSPSATYVLFFLIVIIGYLLLDYSYLRPSTTLFRPQSDITNLPMDYKTDYQFGDYFQLLGYDLKQNTFSAGESIYIRLYWRLLKPTDEMFLSGVTLTGLDVASVWGGVNNLNIGNIPTTHWNTEQYVTDDHIIKIDPNAPPFPLQLRVSILNNATFEYLEGANGTTILLHEINIRGDRLTIPADDFISQPFNFGDVIHLLGYAMPSKSPDNRICVQVRWQAVQPILRNYQVMVHGLNTTQSTQVVADTSPFNGLNPTHYWLPQQKLDDIYCIDDTVGADQIHIALYDLETLARLPLFDQHGQQLMDDILRLVVIKQ